MRAVVVGLLARHELYVARFYLGRGKFDAAVARCEHALSAFDHSGLEPEALVLMGETYMKQKEREKARATLERVLQGIPGEPVRGAGAPLPRRARPEPRRRRSRGARVD